MVRSEEVKGNVVARLVVSIFLVIKSLSRPVGIADWKASSICSDATFEIRSRAPNVLSNLEVTDSSSSGVSAEIVM